MKAILVMFDSLSRNFLPPYGNDWVIAPNFKRLADHSVTFDRCYVGSMPCMPARRELHTGRYNFLHRGWGPLEPFDDSMPQLLSQNGIHTHLASDHYHYWEDGGATYHQRYSTWENVRGQEGDKWKGEVRGPDIPEHAGAVSSQDLINRKYMKEEKDTSQARTFDAGLEFIETNHTEDDWFLQIECFDPHPPFVSPEKYQQLYDDDYSGPMFDWPNYAAVKENETPDMIEHCRKRYASLVSMCDHSLGRVLDAMDQRDLWKDTMLIVTTDHGFLLGEHDWWAFVKSPFYEDVGRKPLFVWDPRSGKKGARNAQLAQMIDMPATLLEYFDVERPKDMQGVPLRETIANDAPIRDAALLGVFGGHVNCTDGRHMYMRAPASAENQPLHHHTLIPLHMRDFFSLDDLRQAELADPFEFTKGCKVLKTPGKAFMQDAFELGNLLFDTEADPAQESVIDDPEVEKRMRAHMIRLMRENDAPKEQFQRLGLNPKE